MTNMNSCLGVYHELWNYTYLFRHNNYNFSGAATLKSQWSMFILVIILGKYQFDFAPNPIPFYFFSSSYNFWLINTTTKLLKLKRLVMLPFTHWLKTFHSVIRLTIWLLWAEVSGWRTRLSPYHKLIGPLDLGQS